MALPVAEQTNRAARRPERERAVGRDMAEEEKSSSSNQPTDLETTSGGSDGLATTVEVDTTVTELQTSATGYVMASLGPPKQARRKGKK